MPPTTLATLSRFLLSEAFYREIVEHPIPVEREVIAALAHAPGLLDFYAWITWKSWRVNGPPAHIPLFGVNGLCNQLGTTQYSVDRLFRHKFAQWLRQVKANWPECPPALSADGHYLVVRSSKKSTAIHSVESPVKPCTFPRYSESRVVPNEDGDGA